ncbi:MAG: BamA/TamA family outer membrane protein [Gemmatimonadetes bacterium]|jgi:hypothetical protein|nr:BamA/TamA family outer membrane protein [Gemmatimonadota bacterium]
MLLSYTWKIGMLIAALLLGSAVPGSARKRAYENIGWKLTPIPIANFSSDDGAGYGLRTYLYEYDGKSIPYRRAYSIQGFFTSKGKWVHRLQMDVPNFIPGQRLEIELVYEKEKFANYYGELGNEEVDRLLGMVDEETRKQRTTFKQAHPLLRVTTIRNLRGDWRVKAEVGATHGSITPNADEGSLLEILDPLGADGGWLLKFSGSLHYDTRDDYTNCSKGLLEEFLIEYGLGKGGDFNGVKFSLEHRHFLPLGESLIFAHRAGGDITFGDVPFYEELKLGGSSTVRGLAAARVRGQGRFLFNAELRWQGIPLYRKRSMYLGGLLFADAGQIFSRREGPSLDDWRTSRGGGLRFHWHSTVLRADYGLSGDRTGLYITFSQVF